MSSHRRIAVTGGSGFIGTNLVEHLRGLEDVDVVNLDRAAPRHPEHSALWRRVDLCDPVATVEAFGATEPDVVVHLAARTDLDGAELADYAINTVGVRSVIEAAAGCGAERVLFGSSQLVCTPGHRPVDEYDYSPPNAYGRSKVVGEELVRELADDRFTWALLRPTSIWGPWWGPLYSTFFRTVRAGRYLHPRGTRIRKSFGYVGNTVHQLEVLTRVPPDRLHARMLYVADYEAYPIHEWADEIAAAFGVRAVREVPLWLLRALAAGGDVARRFGVSNPPISSYRLSNMLTETIFDLEPLRALCGPLPVGRIEGVSRTVEWMRHQDDST